MINNKEISFVIQGALNPEIYPKITENIQQFFPGAEIILATYAGTNTNGLDHDKIALVEDPGYYPIIAPLKIMHKVQAHKIL